MTELLYRGVKHTINNKKAIEPTAMLYRGVKHNPTLRQELPQATSGIYRGFRWTL